MISLPSRCGVVTARTAASVLGTVSSVRT